MHNHSDLCGDFLKSKYFPYHDLKHEPPPVNKNYSWIWQSITHGINIIHQFSKWKVGTGTSINICKHNWIPSETNSLYKWNDLNINEVQWVNQLINSDSNEWNILLLRQLFSLLS